MSLPSPPIVEEDGRDENEGSRSEKGRRNADMLNKLAPYPGPSLLSDEIITLSEV
jgi:hypothetical protein